MIQFLMLFCNALSLIVLVDVVASWLVKSPDSFPRNITGAITGPLYAPFRMILKPENLGGLDLSPMVVIVLLNFARQGLAQLPPM